MNNYDDIINLDHYNSLKRPRMSILSRASIFSPFSALNGYNEAIYEASRVTKCEKELEDNKKDLINYKLNEIKDLLNPKILVTYFIKDKTKSGGEYITKVITLKKIDILNNILILSDKTKININDIIDIEIKNE